MSSILCQDPDCYHIFYVKISKTDCKFKNISEAGVFQQILFIPVSAVLPVYRHIPPEARRYGSRESNFTHCFHFARRESETRGLRVPTYFILSIYCLQWEDGFCFAEDRLPTDRGRRGIWPDGMLPGSFRLSHVVMLYLDLLQREGPLTVGGQGKNNTIQ